MRGVRKVLSGLLVMIAVPLLSGLITVQAAATVLSDPQTLKDVVSDSGFYPRMEESLADVAVEQLLAPGSQIPFNEVEVTTVVRAALPAAQLEEYGDQLITAFQGWVMEDIQEPNLLLDLTGPKARFITELRVVLEQKVEALPVCDGSQSQSQSDGFPPCKSPDPATNQAMIDQALAELDLENTLPNRLDLAEQLGWDRFQSQIAASGAPNGSEAGPAALFMSRWWPLRFNRLPAAWGVLTALLFVLAVLNLDRWYTPFRTLGFTLISGGGLILAGSLFTLYLLTPLSRWVPQDGPSWEVGLAIGDGFLGLSAAALRNSSLAVVLIGVGCAAVALFGARFRQSPPTDDQRVAS